VGKRISDKIFVLKGVNSLSFPLKTNENRVYKQYKPINQNKRKVIRKSIKKRKKVKFRFYVIMLIFLGFILPKSFSNVYDSMIFNRINNSKIVIPDGMSLVKRAEQSVANDNFLGNNLIADINHSNNTFKSIPLTETMQNLTARLKNLASQNPQITPGIFIFDYSTGKYVNINSDQEFSTASMIKIPILLQLFKRAETGYADLNDKMSITNYYLTSGSGYLQYKPVGTKLSVINLAAKMIQESDNTATNMLLSTVGGVNDFNRALKLWGFANTHMSNWLPDLEGTNVATPSDFGKLLYNIDNPDFLSLKSRATIVDIMSNVKNRFLIQAGLPDNVQFIHKTGDIGTMLGDAGIVNLPDGRKYIIVVMVKRPWNSYTAKQFIIDASKITYNSYVSNNL
jgi:beta-lactamase class A